MKINFVNRVSERIKGGGFWKLLLFFIQHALHVPITIQLFYRFPSQHHRFVLRRR